MPVSEFERTGLTGCLPGYWDSESLLNNEQALFSAAGPNVCISVPSFQDMLWPVIVVHSTQGLYGLSVAAAAAAEGRAFASLTS